jgi:predicted phosphodiesterase
MKFAIIGDTHFDFWLLTNFKEKHFHLQFRKLLETVEADVLLLPGDIGHCNAQNLQYLQYRRQYFDRIVVTFGNHDYYLITNSVREKYQYCNPKHPSEERVLEMKKMIEDAEGIDYVDGNIVEIGGIRIGGASGWYDGSLLIQRKKYDDVNLEWRLQMNDANLIYPSGNNDGVKFDSLFHEQKYRLDAVYQKCDIMMTHVSPLSEWKQFAQMFDFQPALAALDSSYARNHEALHDYRAFYCFDGKEYLENGSMKHWVFGHTHRNFQRSYERQDGKVIDIRCNSIGYPKKRQDSRVIWRHQCV